MATRTISAAGGNYNATGTWDEGAVPTSSDAVVCRADGTSGNLTITAAAAALSVDLTNGSGYSGTLTINSSQTWTISGSVTLSSTMTWTATTGTIATGTTGTWTFNGKKIPCAWSITAAVTITLADAGEVDGAFSCTNTGTTTLNGSSFSLRCNGNVTLSGTTAGNLGTFRFGGTGTWVGSSTSTRRLQLNTTIDTAGTLTIGSNARIGNGTTLTYVSGTIVNGTISINGNCTLSVDNAAMDGVSYSVDGTTTLTLSADLTCNQFGLGSNVTMSGSFNVACTTLLYFGTCTLTRVNSWTVGTLTINASFTATVEGAYDQTVSVLNLASSGTLSMRSGQTLTITTTIGIGASNYTLTSTVKSITASSPITLDYQGTFAEAKVYRATFTDVNMATGKRLWNWHGGTLTRTSGIINFNRPPVMYRAEVYYVS